ncbi:TPA: PAAR domain-containing protein [Vibrio parahaemolyticus]|nr:PAAR domain-containing protein [Vibrio parahaemolyticus]
MGKPITIVGCVDSGHPPYAPGTGASGNELFKVNGVAVMCTGDPMTQHVAPDKPPHSGTLIGSSKLTINGKEAGKVGDVTSCGATILTGQSLFTVT